MAIYGVIPVLRSILLGEDPSRDVGRKLRAILVMLVKAIPLTLSIGLDDIIFLKQEILKLIKGGHK